MSQPQPSPEDEIIRSAEPARGVRWPIFAALLLLLGWLLGGSGGLLIAAVIATAAWLLGLLLRAASLELPALRLRHRGDPVRPMPGFTRTVSAVEWGLNSPYDYDTSLRPRIQRVLAARLVERRRIDLSGEPELVRGLIGEELWSLVDPGRPASRDRESPGPSPQTLGKLIEAIERI